MNSLRSPQHSAFRHSAISPFRYSVTASFRHSRASGNPGFPSFPRKRESGLSVIPAQAGIQGEERSDQETELIVVNVMLTTFGLTYHCHYRRFSASRNWHRFLGHPIQNGKASQNRISSFAFEAAAALHQQHAACAHTRFSLSSACLKITCG